MGMPFGKADQAFRHPAETLFGYLHSCEGVILVGIKACGYQDQIRGKVGSRRDQDFFNGLQIFPVSASGR